MSGPSGEHGAEPPLLAVEDLRTTFTTQAGELVAVDEVDFSIEDGETVCIVGESGSGKTVATESVTRLVDTPPGTITGSTRFRGRDLQTMSDTELRSVRGNNIAHIFQNPQEAMNHCFTVGWQIVEALQAHQDVPDETAREQAVDLLDRVGIANASSRFDDYPHELSGGQKQRAMIAMALVGNPDLLIADEPTTALDVTVQGQILELLNDLQEEYGMGILLVTHDLGVVAQVADRIVVMYAGKVMERGDVYDIFERPAHPYTQALMRCLPGKGEDTRGISGSLPDPTDPPDGCRFAPRCEHAIGECEIGDQPDEISVDTDHEVSCIYYQQGYDTSTVRDETLEADSGDGRGASDD